MTPELEALYRELGLRPWRFSNPGPRQMQPWDAEDDERLLAMLDGGLSRKIVARAMGRSRGSINQRALALRKAAAAGTQVTYVPAGAYRGSRSRPLPPIDGSEA